ncbi:MAG: hypothetical protein JXB47_17815, partial [Anaerolineae bacterium]|nr:hypothetical protein [Anaerolineae bacterium]
YTLTLDGRQVECKGLSCLIANVRSLGRLNMTLGQAIRADDGMLDVIVIDRVLSYALLSLAAGTSETAPVMQHHWQAREIVIEADPPQAFQGDGDMWGKTPVEVRALPDAVRVMMPK